MVEIEAKEAVISQTLQSSQEAIAGYDIQNLSEMDQSAQAILENLRDREAETSREWKSLQENVFAWKGQIYEMYEAANAFDENVKVINELCDKSESKEVLQHEEIGAGD